MATKKVRRVRWSLGCGSGPREVVTAMRSTPRRGQPVPDATAGPTGPLPRVLARARRRQGQRSALVANRPGREGAQHSRAGPTSMTSGRPLPSVRWWIFVLSPPRERPMPWSGGAVPCRARFVSLDRPPGGVLVGAVDGGVHRHVPVQLPGRVRPGQQVGVDPVPRPVGRHRLRRPLPRGQWVLSATETARSPCISGGRSHRNPSA